MQQHFWFGRQTVNRVTKDNRTTSYLPWYFPDLYYPPLCTSLGCILQLCKASPVLAYLFRRSCTYKKYGQRDWQTRWFLYTPLKYFFQYCLQWYIGNHNVRYWDRFRARFTFSCSTFNIICLGFVFSGNSLLRLEVAWNIHLKEANKFVQAEHAPHFLPGSCTCIFIIFYFQIYHLSATHNE